MPSLQYVALLQPVRMGKDIVLTSCAVATPSTQGVHRALPGPEFAPLAAIEVCLLLNLVCLS